MSYRYRIHESEAESASAFIVYADGTTDTVPAAHPYAEQIFQALRGGASEETVKELIATLPSVAKEFTRITDRVTMRGKKLYFDNDRIRGPLVKQIIRSSREHDDRAAYAWVEFLEKLQTNPSEHSRESLYRWLRDRDFTITQDGDFIAYKAVLAVEDGGVRRSWSRGTAIVNGVLYHGQIPNPDGAVVEMPRSQVAFDPAEGCSTGLHVGTWDYAVTFLGHDSPVLAVLVSPRDVVSVPTDCDAQKMRVCRYQVLREATRPYWEPVIEVAACA